MNEKEMIDSYPDGRYVVAGGSPAAGFKLWGPFKNVKEAVEWIDEREPLLGSASVMEIKDPSSESFYKGLGEMLLD